MKTSTNFMPSAAGKSLDILDLPNCIYLLENGRCRELALKKCIGNGCRFCVLKENFNQSKVKWSNRLNSLDAERQREISMKYYSGKMPWKQI